MAYSFENCANCKKRYYEDCNVAAGFGCPDTEFKCASYEPNNPIEPCCFCAYRNECALPMRVRLGVRPLLNTKCDHFKPQTVLSNCNVKCSGYDPEEGYYCRAYKDKPQCFTCMRVADCKYPMAYLFRIEMEKRSRESDKEPAGKFNVQKMMHMGHLFIIYESGVYELVQREDRFRLVEVEVLSGNKIHET